MNQLKTEYKRDMKNNYMLISFEDESDIKPDTKQYEFKMLENNYIAGLMKLKLCKEGEKEVFYYDITSKRSLSDIYKDKGIGMEDIKKIIFGIIKTISNMERFLLESKGLLLNIDYIYADPKSLDPVFCYLPCAKEISDNKLSYMFEQLLSRFDQNDREGFEQVYRLYQESCKDSCVLNDLVNIMNIYNKNTEKATILKVSDADGTKEGMYEYDKEEIFENKKKDKAKSFSIKSLFKIKKEKNKRSQNKAPIPDSERSYKTSQKEEKNGYEDVEEECDKEKDEWMELFNTKTCEKSRETYEDMPYTHTLLLSEDTDKEVRYILISKDKSTEDIKLPYFPFIIGKQERICDHILKNDKVSRLHLRIDKDREEEFSVRDLNSLNGTKLDGRLLDNEETAKLIIGNEIEIADLKYVFSKI
jgi:hypothetical protein